MFACYSMFVEYILIACPNFFSYYFHPGSPGSAPWRPVRGVRGGGARFGSSCSSLKAGCSGDRLLAGTGQSTSLSAPAPGSSAGHGLWRADLDQPAWSHPTPAWWLVVFCLLLCLPSTFCGWLTTNSVANRVFLNNKSYKTQCYGAPFQSHR